MGSMRMAVDKGFTLAELLLALVILGVIATFTIPKVLTAQQDQSKNATTKETIAMISSAFQSYKLQNQISTSTHTRDLTPYMNYVAVDTTSVIDDTPGNNSIPCSTNFCLKLHVGGLLRPVGCTFDGTGPSDAVAFFYDPDGNYSNSTTGPGKAVHIFVYADGHIRTRSSVNATTNYCAGTIAPGSDPTWFSWN